MKKIISNKYVLMGITLVIGGLIGWFVKPSSGPEVGSEHVHTVDEAGEWTCSMHPQIRQNEPGSCPICGMDLIPVESDNKQNADPLAISMSPTAMKLASVSTEIVGSSSATKAIRLTGKVMEDERKVFMQSSHIPGRIEDLLVDFTGAYVQQGQVIASVYSPELVTAQQELFEAAKVKISQPELFEAARRKLQNWKLSNTQIDQILAHGRPLDNLPIHAERSGFVVEKLINPGDYVSRGSALYKIADLSRVWVLFDVYESDMQWVNKGDEIEFTVSSVPETTFKGRVTYVDPTIDPRTRVARARVEVQNKGRKLKPEMFATGILQAGKGRETASLIVPKSAVMWTGMRSVVYVKANAEQGVYFRLREVTLGPALADTYVIEDGLTAGEEIATHGTFSIDAAAQLAGKPSMMSPEADGTPTMTGHDHGQMQSPPSSRDISGQDHETGHPEVNMGVADYDVRPEFRSQLKQLYLQYLEVKDALVSTDATEAASAATALLETIGKVDMSIVSGEAHMAWMKDLKVLSSTSEIIADGSNVEKQRTAFSPLSDQLYYTLKRFKVATDGYRQFCPMANNDQGAYWLSVSEEIRNPYFGDAMLTCGNVEEELAFAKDEDR